MAKYEKQLREEFLKFIADHSPRYGNWYVGVAKKAEDALYKKHKVDKKQDLWLWDIATDNREAKMLEEHLLMMGVDGDAINSDPKAIQVYIYKKTTATVQ